MKKIIGIDIGRDTATCCVLTEFAPIPQRHFKQIKSQIKTLKTDVDGVNWLISQQPDGLVMEPTGKWYSSFWAELARQHNIPVYWIGHSDLAAQRKSYGFKNKFDAEDAYCLALTYFDERFIDINGEKRWLEFSPAIDRVRNIFFELEQVDKLTNSTINQVRQRLCLEFPEAARRDSQINRDLGYAPLWGYLAGLYTYKRIEKIRANSVAVAQGIEISTYTRQHAQSICDLQIRRCGIESELIELLKLPEFKPYIDVFINYRFGLRTKCLLLLQCYPIQKFLVNGKPFTEREEKTNKKGEIKIITNHRSLKSFHLYLGVGRTWKESGEESKWVLAGSDICRCHLYCWALCEIFPEKKASNPIPLRMNEESKDKDAWTLDGLKESNVPGKSKVMRILFKTVRWLFYDLVKSCNRSE
jgi:hypothetical protein